MYYSDKYNEIPLGIVDKKITGCGISSFALENQDPLVLVVPTVALIKNKSAQYPNTRRTEYIFGLYADISIKELTTYLAETKVPKIMVTYDSFHKLRKLINKDYHIVVDEFSDLLDAYSYRNKAVNKLLTNLLDFDKVSYVSATPIDKEFLPNQLKELPYTELIWDNTEKVTVEPYQTTKPLYAVLNIINRYKQDSLIINDIKSECAYFYVNSVTMIRDILDKADLLNSEVRIICSDNKENQKKLGYYDISTSEHPEKKYNFITSCSFKGVDLYSDSGLAIVVSNNKNKHTLVSIDTDIYQIAGRIRTEQNPFRNYLIHIFNENPLNISQEEFDAIVKSKTKTTNNWLSGFNKVNDEEKEALIKSLDTSESYLNIDEQGTVYFDELLVLLEKRIFKDIIQVYQSGLSINAFYKDSDKFELNSKKSIKLQYVATKNFRKTCEWLEAGEIDVAQASISFPIIKEALETLQIKDFKRLQYNLTKIRNELNNSKYTDILNKEIEKLFEKNTFYSSKDVKIKLENLYKELGIDKKPKSTDIEKTLNIKRTKKTMDNVRVNGYQF